jgi:transcriptional antiterminator
MSKFINRKQFADSLGLSKRTLERKLKNANIVLPKGLLSPKDQIIIKQALGFVDGDL